ncbi:MAG: hypothetical protein EKK39_09130 [Sphingobacteriales bacterium]|uniref:rhodanese-like domain-containing protein n=1 Tax=Hydrotalea flava TaxID=714549 RepID=UPI000FAA4DF6|nr:rhodanese-like domain-containing protein [Hydrotalea flava]RTL51071.1 MAG: hypothetical protein EKK39_09130 [Sphingobacteriales bacterium]
MKLKTWIAVALTGILMSCQAQKNSNEALSPDTFQQQIQQPNVQILDVRTAEEFAGGHIEHALQADWLLPDQFQERVKSIDKDKPVYVYCLSGVRSAAAADWLRAHQYKTVYHLAGGIQAWKQANKPLVGESNEPQITMEQYQQMIQQAGPVTLVDFGADWCPPCRKMQPVLDALKTTYGPKLNIVKIDAGKQTDIMKQMNLPAIPVFIIYKNGQEVFRKNGIVAQSDFDAAIKPLL